MNILDRVLGRGTAATLERPMTTTAEVPNTPTGDTPTLVGVDDERLIEIAHRIIPPTTTATHFFICSGNRSLIEAYHGLFRVGAPAYGGSAALYRADANTLSSRQADAAGDSVAFDGQRSMGAKAEAVTDMADVMRAIGAESPGGSVFVAYVTVGPKGVAWVRETYTTVMGDAMRQGILPFRMFETGSTEATEYLLGSFTLSLS